MAQQVLDFKTTYLQALAGEAPLEAGLPFREKLNPDWFDFSLESLYVVDGYLFSLYVSREELEEQQLENAIWALGFYAGEVIRRNSKQHFKWQNWDDFFPAQDTTLQEAFAPTMGTSAILLRADNSFILPICRVIRFIKEGPENSLHYFAQGEIENKLRITPKDIHQLCSYG